MLKSAVGNIAISAFFALFVIANVNAFDSTHNATYVLVAVNEIVYVLLYLIRRRPVATSTSALDWGVAFSGTFIGTLLRPAIPLSAFFGTAIVTVGTLVNIAAVISLNRSIATVPAYRQIKTRGAYSVVRHPMYASEILVIVGYLLVNMSLLNMVIVISNVALLLQRIEREELFLSDNSARYRAYVARVRWRLVPFVF